MRDLLNRGSVWLLNAALLLVRTARFWRVIVFRNADEQAFPQASTPYVKWGELKPNIVF